MKPTEQKNKKAPAYMQIYAQLRDQIISGAYPFGSRLPSKRVLSEEKGVSTITTEHAYALLCDEGYVEARERSGYFVIFHTDDRFAAASESSQAESLKQKNRESAPFPGFPFSVLAKTMRRVLTDYGDEILMRSGNTGCVELREAICSYLARNRGIRVSVRQIVIGSGSEYLYTLIAEMMGRDRVFAIESPSYNQIRQVYEASGVRYEMLPLESDGIRSEALRRCRADVLHVSPYRSYPSGVTASASKRYEYIRWADQGDRYIVEDDFESEFAAKKKSEETLFSLADRENVLYINTFSQTISSSLRVGYMVLPESLLPRFEERVGFYSCTVPTYIQLVLAELINNGDFARHINRVRRIQRKGRFF